jgi:hypothetical protein
MFMRESDQDWNKLGNMSHRRKEDYGKKVRSSCGKTEIDGDAWLSDDLLKMKTPSFY